MTRTILASVAAVLALAGPAAPFLQDFQGVYKEWMEEIKGQQLYFLIRGNCLIFASAEGGDSERMRGYGGEGG